MTEQLSNSSHGSAISPRGFLASFVISFRPFLKRGRGECRAPDAPDSRVCNE